MYFHLVETRERKMERSASFRCIFYEAYASSFRVGDDKTNDTTEKYKVAQ